MMESGAVSGSSTIPVGVGCSNSSSLLEPPSHLTKHLPRRDAISKVRSTVPLYSPILKDAKGRISRRFDLIRLGAYAWRTWSELRADRDTEGTPTEGH
jgi:hypothetical protein